MQAVRHLLSAAEELGLDPRALCQQVRLSPSELEGDDARVPLPTHHALWEAVLAGYPHDDVVPRVARRTTTGDYGVVGFLCMSAPSAEAALQLLTRYLAVYTDQPVLTLEGCRLVMRYTLPRPDRPGCWRAAEATFVEVLHAARQLTGQPLAPVTVSFTHGAPTDRRPLDAFFGTRVQWSAAEMVMEVAPEQLALPLLGSDARLHGLLLPVARDALARHVPEATLVERARRALGGALATGAPTAAEVARKLSMTERTLRRRLASEGVGFKELLEETRARLAREYVADEKLPLCEVAFVLGFSEPSSFHRAFKRWTGKTPAAYRGER